jgi:hypothetical protein
MIFQHLRRRYNVQKARIDLIKAIDQAYAWSDSQFTSLYLREVVDQSYCLALLFLHSEPRCLLPPSAWSEWGESCSFESPSQQLGWFPSGHLGGISERCCVDCSGRACDVLGRGGCEVVPGAVYPICHAQPQAQWVRRVFILPHNSLL